MAYRTGRTFIGRPFSIYWPLALLRLCARTALTFYKPDACVASIICLQIRREPVLNTRL